MSNRKSFIIHIDSLDILDDLTLEQRGELFTAIQLYQKGEEIDLSPIVKIAFSPFKNQFARDNIKYSKTCERRAEAGSKGGKQKVANASKSKQTVANLADSVSKNKNDSKSGSKNKTLDYSSWPAPPNDQTLKDWLSMRNRLKANVSQTVINNFSKQLHLAVIAGHTVDSCLSECVTRNWRGFKSEWMKENEENNRKPKRNLTAVERVEKACRAREAEVEDNRQDDLPALGSDGSHIRA